MKRNKFVVWWFEYPYVGSCQRVWRNFINKREAELFISNQKLGIFHLDLIPKCSWHPDR